MKKAREEVDFEKTFGKDETSEPVVFKSEKRKYRPASEMTKEEFATACVLWESGDYTSEVIAEQFLVYTNSLEGRFSASGSRRSKTEPFKPNEAMKEKAKEIMQFDGFDVAVKIGDTRKRTYSLYQAAESQAASMITQAAKDGVSLAKYKEDFKALKDFVSIVQISGEGKMKMLGVTNDYNFEGEDTLPVLTIAKMTDEEIELAINGTEMNDLDFGAANESLSDIEKIITEGGIILESNDE